MSLRTRAVFHDHGLADQLGEPLSDDPRRDIGCTPRRDRHDQLDRPQGVLRPRSERKQSGERQYRETTHAVLLQVVAACAMVYEPLRRDAMMFSLPVKRRVPRTAP